MAQTRCCGEHDKNEEVMKTTYMPNHYPREALLPQRDKGRWTLKPTSKM
jgi:hypothetical protein